ncbi:MAG: tRNA pseudouridine synthase 1 [Alectoria fallacina]|uniref:tRNA pseudouridine synthase 1 n=1 Tax=Alectoria fallacina TaxID=1903189 RepID=A0A8H3IUH0_9LECA|nr:MAG: tRNA pseudouridine synthase 1 [Alectoria fallacina]
MASQENQGHSAPTTNHQNGEGPFPRSTLDRGTGSKRAGGRGSSRGGGGRGHRGSGAGRGGRVGSNKKKEVGRAEWARKPVDRRARNTERAAKRQRLDGEEEDLPVYATKFSKEEIETQEKKPKRKVAVMLGYSGTGYKGMQLNYHEKTIEGDLFKAFVDAGAISKANADDPKKSSLIRCARTDKGVHAAGNVISLKLIVEDPDIVANINKHLSPQIRVWGIERTNGGFSCYQHCDSRTYQYLIPSHCFLPPHPKSFLAKQMIRLAEEAADLEGYQARQKEVKDIWSKMEDEYVRPVVEEIDPLIREEVLRAFYEHDNSLVNRPSTNISEDQRQTISDVPDQDKVIAAWENVGTTENNDSQEDTANMSSVLGVHTVSVEAMEAAEERPRDLTPVEIALRLLKAAHIKAKKTYRIHPARVTRIRSHLSRYIGTHKFHNYTIEKTYKDPSATRVIKAFNVDATPIIINDTEWLSLKVWGQSFMMHQIRKMVSMVALLVRCGCHESRIQDSYVTDRLSIPKAPSLGLLLERPVFEVYNEKLEGFGYNKIDFSRYEKEMEGFKQMEIYERIFREEERDHTFYSFFAGLDNTQSSQLFYLSSVGVEATKKEIKKDTFTEATVKNDIEEVMSEDDGGAVNEEG